MSFNCTSDILEIRLGLPAYALYRSSTVRPLSSTTLDSTSRYLYVLKYLRTAFYVQLSLGSLAPGPSESARDVRVASHEWGSADTADTDATEAVSTLTLGRVRARARATITTRSR